MNMLSLIGREEALFAEDTSTHESVLAARVEAGRFLVIGGAGSIGQAVTREIFRRHPKALHVVDISENNLVELVRDIRSTLGYIEGDFQTFAIDCAGPEFEALMCAGEGYDYVLNLSALKHVRSEKDPFTLMRLIEVNILNTISTLAAARTGGADKYFCVSTDKATNPVNMMGASKAIMEKFLMRESLTQTVSTARFANVAFSDGSLLHGFNQRFHKRQPIAAPNDVRRYFVTPEESGQLCLMSCLLGKTATYSFPSSARSSISSPSPTLLCVTLKRRDMIRLPAQARKRPVPRSRRTPHAGNGPVSFSRATQPAKRTSRNSTPTRRLDMARFETIGVIRKPAHFDARSLDHFLTRILELRASRSWTRGDLVALFHDVLDNFEHKDTGRFLDSRM